MHVAIATVVEEGDQFMRTDPLANAKLATAMRVLSLVAYNSWVMTDNPKAYHTSKRIEGAVRRYSMRCIDGVVYREKIELGDIFN